ncbi:MAG: PsiF repeat protein [Alcaligenaceae bacterium]|nr:MAG: PsiF repeat protein [Alcaligenaceae bacterium]
MHKYILVAAFLIPFGTLNAQTAQQNLMGTCNAEASGKKGDERKAFMKSCLSDGKKRQQERMKSCNVDAVGKKGEERKSFMSECLKK